MTIPKITRMVWTVLLVVGVSVAFVHFHGNPRQAYHAIATGGTGGITDPGYPDLLSLV